MEKFEFKEEKSLEIFSGFVGKAKNALTNLIENIKENIKGYEQKIEATTKEIEENESSREKCEQEIGKMEDTISEIKDAIENVESTYKKIADAYASTSKGETKELYSEIIDGAKANCEKDVEKNRSEIARLNSDIEAIKNNIAEFTKVIDDLNKYLDCCNLELFKYNKALEYLEKVASKADEDLEEISTKKEVATKPTTGKSTKKSDSKKSGVKISVLDDIKVSEPKSSVLDSIKREETTLVKEEPKKSEPVDDSLQQIFDLTGYRPKEKDVEEPSHEPEVAVTSRVEEKRVYTDNLESLFSRPTEDVSKAGEETSEEPTTILDNDFSSWEAMLNAPTNEPVATKSIEANVEDTVDQLLNPYGTSYKRLKSLVSKEYIRKDGTASTFELTSEDVIAAINSIDGNDLKKMKTVGPEITLLRKVKEMKEGNL